MILLTTSRRPTKRIRAFCRDLTQFVPSIIRVNRGKLSIDGIAERAIELDANRIVVIDRWKEGRGMIRFFRIETKGLILIPPMVYIAGMKLRREFETNIIHVQCAVVTTEAETPTEVNRISEHLSGFFKLQRLSIDEAAAKYEASMHVSFDTSCRLQITFMFLPQMIEMGPRITLSELVWEVPA